MNFSFEYYKKCLQTAIDCNYNFIKCCDYEQINSFEKLIILRHDIDFSLDNALIMSKIENSLQIKSTYFIRLHAKQYNLLEYKNFKIVKEIQSYGHEIALHQEPDFCNQFDNPIDYIRTEISLFNKLFDVNIKGISTHEPSRCGITITPENIKLYNLQYESYFPIFVDNMKYISDSGCRWREGDIMEWIQKGETKIYANTHPFWWYKHTPLENY